jgi:histidine triad (HIT) family protein
MRNDCIFCAIADREVPADILHESDHVVAFRDADPQAPVHILLIPKKHIDSLAGQDARDGEMLTEMLFAASHLARTEGIERSGWRLVSNVGPEGGQTVSHLHFHLLGGRQMTWPPG